MGSSYPEIYGDVSVISYTHMIEIFEINFAAFDNVNALHFDVRLAHTTTITPYNSQTEANPMEQFQSLTQGKESKHESWLRLKEDPLTEIKKAEIEFLRLNQVNPVRAKIIMAQSQGKAIQLTKEEEEKLDRDSRYEAERARRDEKLKRLGLGQMIDGVPNAFLGKNQPRLQKFRDMMKISMNSFADQNSKIGLGH
eukprot:jgi/Bigna1/132120/aug1.16_g6828